MGEAKHPGRNETPQCRGDDLGRCVAPPNPTNVKALPLNPKAVAWRVPKEGCSRALFLNTERMLRD